VCANAVSGSDCSYTSFDGNISWGYCGQYSLELDGMCCLSYSVPELAVQTCNFAQINASCRYLSADLVTPVQGFCRPITPQLFKVPESVVFCHPNAWARSLGSGQTPYGLEFQIVARDSSTNLETLSYGTYQNTSAHPFDANDYPYSNIIRDRSNIIDYGSDTFMVATSDWFVNASEVQQVRGCVRGRVGGSMGRVGGWDGWVGGWVGRRGVFVTNAHANASSWLFVRACGVRACGVRAACCVRRFMVHRLGDTPPWPSVRWCATR
jgi:hypothetical protein